MDDDMKTDIYSEWWTEKWNTNCNHEYTKTILNSHLFYKVWNSHFLLHWLKNMLTKSELESIED